jgi:TolB protein
LLAALVAVGLLMVLASALLVGGARSASQPQGLIAFTRDGADAVYVMRPDGADVRLVWRGSTGPTDVAWFPDGSKLAVSTGRSIWVVNADGTDPVRVARVGASSLSWSADGRRIAFTSKDDVWLMNADGSGMRRLMRTPKLSEGNVDWKPTGGWLAFDSGGWVPFVYVMRTDGSGLHRAARVEGAQPDWSPDGSRIAYTRPVAFPDAVGSIGPENGEIWVMNASGTSQVRLTKNRLYDELPAWSPDGRRIVFVRGESGTPRGSEIWVMNADGTSEKRLTTGASPSPGASVAWQPVARRAPQANGS